MELPSTTTSAFPIGILKSPSGTSSTAARYKTFGSRTMQGSGSLIQDKSNPLAWIGPLGTTTYKNICILIFN